MFCPECGAQIDEGGRFCPKCGTDLWARGAKPEAPVASAADATTAAVSGNSAPVEPAIGAYVAASTDEVGQPTQKVPAAGQTQVTPPAQPAYQPGQVPFMQHAAQVPPQGDAQQGQWQQPGAGQSQSAGATAQQPGAGQSQSAGATAQQPGAAQQASNQQWAYAQQPNQQRTAPQPPMPSAPAPQAAKGCLAQAFDDLMHTPGMLARVMQIALIPGLIAIVPVVGWVVAAIMGVCVTGFAIEWGRSLAHGRSFDGAEKPWTTKRFSLGFFASALSVFWSLLSFIPGLIVQFFAIGGIAGLGMGLARQSSYASLYGSSAYHSYASSASAAAGGVVLIIFLAWLASFVLSIFFGMFSDVSVMHLAVKNRVESGFELKEIWNAYKRDLGKLFCASVLPSLIVAAATTIAVLLVWAIFGAMAAAMYRIAFIFILIAVALTAVGIACAYAFLVMLKNRAIGYWAARYAPEWTNGANN